jgi:hypothetical protein
VVFWISALLDHPAAEFDAAVAFWSAVTGYAASPEVGDDGEYVTLVPPDGDEYLRLQRLGEGAGRVHLDLHVEDLEGTAAGAVAAGAVVLDRPAAYGGYVVLQSPGGLVCCLVTDPAGRVPPAAAWPGVRRSRVYQVCIDIPGDRYGAEQAFWAGLLGGAPEPSARRPEFAWLSSPGSTDRALSVLVQRLDRDDGAMGVHLDLGTHDRAAETDRHVALGACVVSVEEFWTVLRDPTGTAYCITDRDPQTGLLA